MALDNLIYSSIQITYHGFFCICHCKIVICGPTLEVKHTIPEENLNDYTPKPYFKKEWLKEKEWLNLHSLVLESYSAIKSSLN